MVNFETIKSLLDQSSVFYLVSIDMDSKYSYLNKRYKQVFDLTHQDLIGQHYSITMHNDDLMVCNNVAQLCFTYPDQVFPATIRKHDGKGGYITTIWEYKAMFTADHSPAGIFCIGYDLTAFMLASLKLQDVNSTLNDTKDELSQLMFVQSHMIRKPIANLIGLTDLLKNDGSDLNTIISLIKKSANELDLVIKNITKN